MKGTVSGDIGVQFEIQKKCVINCDSYLMSHNLFSGLGAGLVECGFSHISSFFGLIEFVLNLSELGHVGVTGFFGFFSLSLVGLYLDLKFVDEVLKTDKVLLVFFTSIDDFLEFSFKFLLVLGGISGSSLFGIEFIFEFANTLIQFLDLLLATLHGNLFGFIKSHLKILNGGFHVLLHSFQVSRLILFLLEFFSHHSSITDSLLGLFFSIALFLDGFFNFSLSGLEFLFNLSLGVDQSSVLSVEETATFVGFKKFTFSEFAAAFSLFKSSSHFIQFRLEEVGTSVNNSNLFGKIFASSL